MPFGLCFAFGFAFGFDLFFGRSLVPSFLKPALADVQVSAPQAPDPARRSDLKAALDALTPSLGLCDALLTPAERKSTGSLIVAFTITPTGGVSDARIVEKGRGARNVSTLVSARIRSCVLSQVRLWVFPRAPATKGRPPRVNVETPVRFPIGKSDGRLEP